MRSIGSGTGAVSATRRVVARQAIGAILNAESSFQRPESTAHVQSVEMPEVPRPGELVEDSWSDAFGRGLRPGRSCDGRSSRGDGRVVAWMRVNGDLGDPDDRQSQLVHRCWLAYLSDDLPTDAVIRAHPAGRDESTRDSLFCASLDHTIWFHGRLRADRWHLYDFSCLHIVGSRGLALGHVFADDGAHVATVAQEVLVRDPGARPS